MPATSATSACPLTSHFPASWEQIAPPIQLLAAIDEQIYGDSTHQKPALPRVFPPRSSVFRALHCAGSPDHVRVVIVGQDPYIRPGQATGMAFGVPVGTWPLPPSLRNIIKRVSSSASTDTSLQDVASKTFDISLESWARQGVLLLNTALTVAEGHSNSHASIWKPYTQTLLNNLVQYRQKRQDIPPMVFLLWGSHAIQMAKRANCFEESCHHHVVACSHPSPLSCTRPVQGFPPFMPDPRTKKELSSSTSTDADAKHSAGDVWSSCFDECNKVLVRIGSIPVQWMVHANGREQRMKTNGPNVTAPGHV
jgi:uracil-DNA glycosylase